MCSIVGWFGNISTDEKLHILSHGKERGRDGHGFWIDGEEHRGMGDISPDLYNKLLKGKRVVGNFRATPTTEAESEIDILQPYGGIVHNGVIANDKHFSDEVIDSIVLPKILNPRDFDSLYTNIQKIEGSYALAYFTDDSLMLSCNYKPIYFVKRSGLGEYTRYPFYNHGFMFASTPDMIADYSVPVKPYSVMEIDLSSMNIKTKDLPRIQNNKVALSASGGLDSTTVAYMLKEQGYDVTLIHLKYDCLAQEKEVDYIKKIAKHGGFDLEFIQMPNVMRGTITEGTYHKSQIEGTEYAMDWVSGRNLLMLSILTAYAESNKFGYIAFGGNLEESGAYPDNEQEFGRKFNEILPFATQNKIKIELLQPISTMMKHEIVKEGVKLKVPYEITWSCYSNDKVHCNNCAPCYMRRVAFERNGWTDPVFV